MIRIPSFTEKALLNARVLNYVYPTNCELHTVNDLIHSAALTIYYAKDDYLKAPIIKRHWSIKPLTWICRVTYTALVAITISPAGALWNGSLAAKHFTASKFAVNNQSPQEVEKAKAYAQAFFVDCSYFLFGVIGNALLVGTLGVTGCLLLNVPSTMGGIAVLTISFIFNGIFGFLPVCLFGGLDPAESLSAFVSQKDESPGLFLSLMLREKFGIVKSSGDIISYSSLDKFQYDENYNFSGTSHNHIHALLYKLETSVIGRVCAINGILSKYNLEKISFSYRFNISNVMEHVIKQLDSITDNQEKKIIASHLEFLRNMQRHDVISLFRNLYKKMVLKSVSHSELIAEPVKKFESTLTLQQYQKYFEERTIVAT